MTENLISNYVNSFKKVSSKHFKLVVPLEKCPLSFSGTIHIKQRIRWAILFVPSQLRFERLNVRENSESGLGVTQKAGSAHKFLQKIVLPSIKNIK